MKITGIVKNNNSFPKKPKKNSVYLVENENYTPYKYSGKKQGKQIWKKTLFANELDKQNGYYSSGTTISRNIQLLILINNQKIRDLFVGPHNKNVINIKNKLDLYPANSDCCFFVESENKYYIYNDKSKKYELYVLPIIDAYKEVNNKLFIDLNNEKFGLITKIPNPRDFADCVTRKIEKEGFGFEDYFDNFNFGELKTPIKRQIARHVYEKYYSAIKRKKKNKIKIKKISKPKISHDAIRIYDQYCHIDIDKNIISFMPHGNDCFSFEFEHFAGKDLILKNQVKSGKYGGNLIFRKNSVIYNFRNEFEIKWAFQPEDFIGYDLNKTNDSFLVFSKKILFNKKMTDLIRKKDIDSKISQNEKLISIIKKNIGQLKGGKHKKQRYLLNKRIKSIRNVLKKLYEPLAEEIVSYLLKNKICLCLDNVHCGATMGTFGQDNFQKVLIRLLEKSSCPHVICNTEYTSRMCFYCKHVHEKISTDVREFICSNCNKQLIRDKNAAKNIEFLGKNIWNQGIYKTVYDYMKKYKIDITKHSKKNI
jgi:transposase